VNVIKSIQGFINGVHNTWLALPEWFRKGLRGAVLGGIVAVSALNLAIPGSLSEAKAEGLTAFTVFVTTANRARTTPCGVVADRVGFCPRREAYDPDAG
jgi:hypothetical protein